MSVENLCFGGVFGQRGEGNRFDRGRFFSQVPGQVPPPSFVDETRVVWNGGGGCFRLQVICAVPPSPAIPPPPPYPFWQGLSDLVSLPGQKRKIARESEARRSILMSLFVLAALEI